MIIINSIQQLKDQLLLFRKQKKSIGFVPTMGALHQGHLSLIENALKECDLVICSIFVNPTQFNDLNDLDKYPRTIEKDAQMLKKAGCDVLFAPEVNEIYTEQELELKRQKVEDTSWTEGKQVDFGSLDKVMEGAQRPGHFNGVAQVVSKLFRIVEPQKAYFGQKDFQQLAIIRTMVKQLEMPIEIVACPIIREENGLAMSSRNERLTKEERKRAGFIFETLAKMKKLKNNTSIAELKTFVEAQLKTESLIKLEYFEIADAETLQSISDLEQAKSAVACIALKIGEVRLIDNILL
ncbi:MAG: pantoate--beta-alanine ligase [Bacteroidetes bacterium RIFCSPLOWO2_12_FULL_35_15]|nr:MAG: pantoate--beta-alanine ligase [Bacteroidetes bacterium RIFCSPLOWO2_12_FULL_35_15]